MTLTRETESAPAIADGSSARPHRPSLRSRAAGWLVTHRISLVLLSVLLIVVGTAMAWNLQGYPGSINDDEGTYVAEAWAMLYRHDLSHYTYWYDHPPLGWASIALWAWLTDGFNRVSSAVMIGREVMWIAALVSSALIYVLARRLQFHRATAALAVLLFALGPLGIWYHRMISLDNLATMWTLAAFAIAASRRRSLAAAVGSATCFAVATLSKETIALLLPALLWLLWQHTDKATRRWNLTTFCSTYVLLVLLYPLMAVLKGELLPGPGHVSLMWAVQYQLSRQGPSLLVPTGYTHDLATSWMYLDGWTMTAGAVAMIVGVFVARLRPLSIALLLQVLVMVKGGYIPYAFVTGMLPFVALLIAGVIDTGGKAAGRRFPWRDQAAARGSLAWMSPVLWAGVVGACALVVVASPGWATSLSRQWTTDGFANERAATAWVMRNVPTGDVVVVDDYMWPDISHRETDGAVPLWLWKVNGDPTVSRQLLPRGYSSIDYIALSAQPREALAALPVLAEALKHSTVIERFGGPTGVTIYRVNPAPSAAGA